MSTPSPPDPFPAGGPPTLVLSERAMFRRAFARIVESLGHACESLPTPPDGAATRSELVIADLADVDAGAAGASVEALLHALGDVRLACVIDHGDDAAVDALMAAGAAGVLVKALPPTVLTDALRLLLDGGRCRPAPTVAVAPSELPAAVRARLSAREQKMLRLVAGGTSIPAVAAALHLTPAKVVTEMRRIMDVVRGRA